MKDFNAKMNDFITEMEKDEVNFCILRQMAEMCICSLEKLIVEAKKDDNKVEYDEIMKTIKRITDYSLTEERAKENKFH